MRIAKIHCDHCGRQIDIWRGYVDEEIVVATKRIKCDLCADCMEALVDLVEDFCTNVTVEKGS